MLVFKGTPLLVLLSVLLKGKFMLHGITSIVASVCVLTACSLQGEALLKNTDTGVTSNSSAVILSTTMMVLAVGK
jgi:hypothetical protein